MNKYLSLILITSLLLTTSQAYAAKISKHITTVIEPEPIKRISPRYPKSAARNKREGWARLSYIIEEDGSVSNVLVTSTSGSADFAKASKAAVLKWKFKPATENGKPIQQCVNSVQLNFRMNGGGEEGATRRFRAKYNAAQNALKEKDFVETKRILTEMFALKNRHASENNYLHLLASNYEAAMDNKTQQLSHLNNIMLESLAPEVQLPILDTSFILEISEGKYHQAYKTYTRIAKLDIAKAQMERYDRILDKMDAFIGSNNNIVVHANIKNKDYWYYQLVRNTFTLTDIKGSLNKLDVRCANKRHVYTVEDNNTWKIPKAWENCSIYVYGEDNTQFNLVEHPIGA